MMMKNQGIDYAGHDAKANRDTDTGIRYGIIHTSRLQDWVWDEAETEYEFGCPECGQDLDAGAEEDMDGRILCGCGIASDPDDCWGDEPISHTISAGGVAGFIDTTGDLWVTMSPVVRFDAVFCSPCAPGAMSIPDRPAEDDKQIPHATRCYGIPADWYAEDND